MDITEYTIKKSVITWVITILILLGGYIAYEKLGRFEDPEFIIRQAVVVTHYPGATPEQVAKEITDVIEGAAQQLQEVDEVTSVSRFGESIVKVEAKQKFSKNQKELDQVWEKLRSKIQDTHRALPPGASTPVVKGDFGDVFALFYAITGDDYTPRQIYDYADLLRRELALVDGVANVVLLGERKEAIYVEISRERSAQLGISIDKVYASLKSQNLMSAAGEASAGALNLEIVPDPIIKSDKQLKDLIVAGNNENGLVKLGDIAEIHRTYKDPDMLMRYDGKPAIGLGVSNVVGGNVVEMGDAVKQRIEALENQRPLGVKLNVVSFQSDSVRAAVNDFVANLVAAVVIVVIVLLFFMGVRSGLIIGAILVLTVAATLIVMFFDGIAMQRISLGALIIALGMLVDNAIVITDGILVGMQKGETASNASKAIVKATIWPLLGGTIVGILAFSAIGLSPTDMGEYAGSLFWVILYSMLFSWIFAVTLTPFFCVRFLGLPKSRDTEIKPGMLLSGYKRLLNFVLSRRITSGVVVMLLFVAGIVGFSLVPPGFMPDSARPQFVVDVYLPQGTDLDETVTAVSKAEHVVQAKTGVTHISSFIGQGALRFMLTYSPEDPNSGYGQLLIDVEQFSDIPRLIKELQPELEQSLPNADVKVWKFMLGRGGGKKIEAAFRGPDPKVLRKLADEAKSLMANDPEAIAVQDDWRELVPVLQPKFSTEAAQRAGVLPSEISAALERTFTGTNIGVFRENEKLIPIIARAPASEREGAEDLRYAQVFSQTAGKYVPIDQFLEKIEVSWQNAIMRRDNRFPMIKAQCDPPAGQLSAPLLERLKPKIEMIELPPGYSLEWHGEYKASKEANEGLAQAAPYGFLAMVVAVIFMFNSLRHTAVIWLTVPLAVVGVAIGLLIFNAPFEFMAILGFLSLTGMLIKNSIVLVDQVDVEISSGKPGYQAIIDASLSRARPVFLSAVTTVLGVAPLLADPFFKSMAITIMFGLIFATGLTLVVVPLLYAAIFGIKQPSKVTA